MQEKVVFNINIYIGIFNRGLYRAWFQRQNTPLSVSCFPIKLIADDCEQMRACGTGDKTPFGEITIKP